MNTLKNILTLAGKELRSLLGDPILIILTLYMYTGVVIAMSQSNTDLKHAAVAVIDEDHSTLSYRIRDAILPPYFQPPVEIARDSADSHRCSSTACHKCATSATSCKTAARRHNSPSTPPA